MYGLTVRREQQVRGALVSRVVGRLDFVGDNLFRPSLITAGVDLGVRVKLRPISLQAAVGPTPVYFVGSRGRPAIPCQDYCVDTRPWYTPGARLAITGALAIGVDATSTMRLLYEARGHVPLRIGQAGFRRDPHAAFVEATLGVAVTP